MADLTCDRCIGQPHTKLRIRCHDGGCVCEICHPDRWAAAMRRTVEPPAPPAAGPVKARPKQAPPRERTEPIIRPPMPWAPGPGDAWTVEEMAQVEAARAAGYTWADIDQAIGRQAKSAHSIWKRTGRLQPLRGARGPYNTKGWAA
jgi:hypothetical protein